MRTLLGLLMLVCLANCQRYDDYFDPATTEFALKLYRQIDQDSDGSKNIVFSPLSIFTAFGMLKAGAKGNTNKQMDIAMSLNKLAASAKSNDGHSAVQNLLKDVFAPLAANNTISVANKLWMQKYFCLQSCKEFIGILQSKYSATLEEVNFVAKPEVSRKTINKWVEDKTNKKIKDLLPAGSVSTGTRFVLTNAIHFKSKWKKQFDKKDTTDRSFDAFGKNGVTTKQVPMMYQNARFLSSGFMPTAPYKIIELPYEDSSLSMIVIVPRDRTEMRKIERNNQPVKKLDDMLKELNEFSATKLDVLLPKFKVSSDLNLKGYMQKMGMSDVFSSRQADLSGITGYKGLYVSAAVHKAYINVDEEGTEAAAATGINIALASLPFQFTVDKPFVYIIRHKTTGTILFMGRVMDPTAL